MLEKRVQIVAVILVLILINSVGWNIYIKSRISTIEKETDKVIKENEKKIDSIQVILKQSDKVKTDLLKENNELKLDRNKLTAQVDILKRKRIVIHKEADSLSDDSLKVTILRYYAEPVNGYSQISLPRPVTEWLYESSKELDLLIEEYNLLTNAYNISLEEIDNYDVIVDEYEMNKLLYNHTLQYKDNQLEASQEAGEQYKDLLKKSNKENLTKTAVIAIETILLILLIAK